MFDQRYVWCSSSSQPPTTLDRSSTYGSALPQVQLSSSSSSLQLCLCSREWRRHAELRLHLHPHTHPGQPLGLLHLLPCHEARLRGDANLLGKIRSETFLRWFDVCVTQTGVGPFCPVVSVQLCSRLLLFQGGEEL